MWINGRKERRDKHKLHTGLCVWPSMHACNECNDSLFLEKCLCNKKKWILLAWTALGMESFLVRKMKFPSDLTKIPFKTCPRFEFGQNKCSKLWNIEIKSKKSQNNLKNRTNREKSEYKSEKIEEFLVLGPKSISIRQRSIENRRPPLLSHPRRLI